MDRKTENQLRREIAEVWALLDAERAGRAALIRRIEQEEQSVPDASSEIFASRCPMCSYQHGHQIGCENNPIDIALRAADLATLREKAAQLEQVEKERDEANARLHDVSVACATAEQERDELRKDAELGKCIHVKFRLMKGSTAVRFLGCLGVNEPEGGFDWSKTVLELIDAAIAQEQTK